MVPSSQSRLAGLVLLAVSVLAPNILAAPSVGATRPAVRLSDAWDRTLDLSRLAGTPVLLLYEDKASSSQNQALKNELSTLARGDLYKGRVTLVAIADVQDYNFWPARGFVRDALQLESRKIETDIYCDWDGGVRSALGIRRRVSTVVLYGREGTALFASEGPMPEAKRAELIELLRREMNVG